jgi:prepilin-type N-terminal cleavage/methylation domain-containing protein
MKTHNPLKRTRSASGKSGFTLLELSIAVLLVVLVGTTAVASLRMSLRTLGGIEATSQAVAAVRELREYSFPLDVDAIDAMDGVTLAPIMGDGEPLPGVGDLMLEIAVDAVDDLDPTQTVLPIESRTRVVTVYCWTGGRMVLEAKWLVAEH